MLPVSLDCPYLIVPSVLSNVFHSIMYTHKQTIGKPNPIIDFDTKESKSKSKQDSQNRARLSSDSNRINVMCIVLL